MKTTPRTDAMRRHVAAVHFSVSGSTQMELLDPRYVLVGAGPAIPEQHRHQFAGGLAAQRRCMIYFEFAHGANVIRPKRIHVAEPSETGASWFDDCVLWTAEGFAEIEIVPVIPGSRSRYVGRGGGLRHVEGRPAELEQGRLRAEARFMHTVEALKPADLSGQNRIEAADTTDSWWQHFGFAIRP